MNTGDIFYLFSLVLTVITLQLIDLGWLYAAWVLGVTAHGKGLK